MTDWILPFFCGLGASVISAWGVGGGTLLLLVMTLFLGVDQRTAQGINLLFFLPTAVSALVCHWKNGYLDKPSGSICCSPGPASSGRGRKRTENPLDSPGKKCHNGREKQGSRKAERKQRFDPFT